MLMLFMPNVRSRCRFTKNLSRSNKMDLLRLYQELGVDAGSENFTNFIKFLKTSHLAIFYEGGISSKTKIIWKTYARIAKIYVSNKHNR